MIKEDQKKFYARLGKALTDARKRRNISIAALAKQSGEQNKTIRAIEAGQVCSLHHAAWMWNILRLDITEIIREGNSERLREIEKEFRGLFGIEDII